MLVLHFGDFEDKECCADHARDRDPVPFTPHHERECKCDRNHDARKNQPQRFQVDAKDSPMFGSSFCVRRARFHTTRARFCTTRAVGIGTFGMR